MPDITQLPEDVTVTCVHGDALAFATTLGINVTGDTIAAYVYEDTAAGWAATQAATPTYAATFTATVTTAATGVMSLAITANATKALNLAKSYRWYIRSANLARVLKSGVFAVRAA